MHIKFHNISYVKTILLGTKKIRHSMVKSVSSIRHLPHKLPFLQCNPKSFCGFQTSDFINIPRKTCSNYQEYVVLSAYMRTTSIVHRVNGIGGWWLVAGTRVMSGNDFCQFSGEHRHDTTTVMTFMRSQHFHFVLIRLLLGDHNWCLKWMSGRMAAWMAGCLTGWLNVCRSQTGYDVAWLRISVPDICRQVHWASQ